MSNLEAQLNEFLGKLVDEGEFDLASKFVDILEEHDLLAPDTDDEYPSDAPDVDQER